MSPGTKVRSAAVVAVVLVLSGCFWSRPGAGPGRGSHNSFEKKISAESVAGLVEVWSATVDGGDAVRYPITSDKGVHVSAGPTLYGFNTKTGNRLWDRTPDHEGSIWEMGPATFANDVLWSGSGTAFTSATVGDYVTEFLDPATGEVVGEPGSDDTRDGMVDGVVGDGYVLTFGDLISAPGLGWLSIDVRDPADASFGWRGRIAFLSGNSWLPLTLGIDFVYHAGAGPPRVDDNGNPVPPSNVRGYSTQAKPEDCPPIPPPYQGLGTFVCPTWDTSVDVGTPSTSPVLDIGRSRLFVGTRTYEHTDGAVHALDATTGDILWSTSVGTSVMAEPALADGTLFVPLADGRLVALGADTGDVLWEAQAGDRLEVQPAVAGGVVFTGSGDGLVHAFDAAGCGEPACEPLWSDSTGSEAAAGEITGAPAVSQGQLYIGTADGRLIAYGLP